MDKDTEFELAANGILGLQTTVPLMLELVHQKKLSLDRMIGALCVCSIEIILTQSVVDDRSMLPISPCWILIANGSSRQSSWHPKVQNSPFLGRDFQRWSIRNDRGRRNQMEYTVMSKGLLILGSNGKEEVFEGKFLGAELKEPIAGEVVSILR